MRERERVVHEYTVLGCLSGGCIDKAAPGEGINNARISRYACRHNAQGHAVVQPAQNERTHTYIWSGLCTATNAREENTATSTHSHTLDEDCARLGVLEVLHECVLLLPENVLVHVPSPAEHLRRESVQRVERLASARKRHSARVQVDGRSEREWTTTI